MRTEAHASRRTTIAISALVAMTLGAAPILGPAQEISATTCSSPGTHPVNVGSGNNALTAVAFASRCNGWAVGVYADGNADQTLVEQWNGNRWRRVASRNPGGLAHDDELLGVAVTSSRDAWAVGDYSNGAAQQTLIQHWNGNRWKRVASRNPGGSERDNVLSGVAATSASDAWAVGYYVHARADQTLI